MPRRWNNRVFRGFPPWHARVGMVIISCLLIACDQAPRPPSAQNGPNQTTQWPTTLEAAVEDVIGRMNPQELDAFRSMSRKELVRLHHGLGRSIRNRYGLWNGNTQLMQSVCRHIRYKALCEPDTVSKLIIETAWETLQQRSLCEKSGGRWVHDGMFGQAQYCQYTYADGGKPCRSSKLSEVSNMMSM